MEERIRKAVEKALKQIGAPDSNFVVERPTNVEYGDYTTNAAMTVSMSIGGSIKIADKLAQILIDELGKDLVSHIAVAGPGFVNITLSPEAINLTIAEADAKGKEWGTKSIEGDSPKRVMIEFTDPNPFKEMHIGHLMSNVIGESISRLIENAGAKLIRANYQGDVGPHVAKAIWGLKKSGITEPTTSKEMGTAYSVGSIAYDESSEAKADIDAINQEIYKGTNSELMELWRKGRDISLEEFEQLYKILGTHFDYYFFESETAKPGLRIVQDGLNKGIFEESEGAIIYRGEKKGLHTLVFITNRGTPTYEAKDIGLAFLKEERVKNDRSLIVTATEQIGHFKVMFAALEEISPLIAKKTNHIPHGFLRLTTGKMSSREGNVITAKQFIEDVIKKASEKNPDPLIAEQVALGAIKFMILRQAPGSDIIFDPEKSLSLDGDSGPYLQYSLVRARSVLEKARNHKHETQNDNQKMPYTLERLIIHFPEVVTRATHELSPNLLVNYLIELSSEWNSFYAKEKVIGGENETRKLTIVRAFVNTMTNGLNLLGIPTPNKM